MAIYSYIDEHGRTQYTDHPFVAGKYPVAKLQPPKPPEPPAQPAPSGPAPK